MVLETDEFNKPFFDPSGEQEKEKKGVSSFSELYLSQKNKGKNSCCGVGPRLASKNGKSGANRQNWRYQVDRNTSNTV